MLKIQNPEQLVSTLAAPLKLAEEEGKRLLESLSRPIPSKEASATATKARELAERYGLFKDAWHSK